MSQLFDASPTCDGAAAVVLVADHTQGDPKRPGVRILASASAVGKGLLAGAADDPRGFIRYIICMLMGSCASADQLAVAARPDPLHLSAVKRSTELVRRRCGQGSGSPSMGRLLSLRPPPGRSPRPPPHPLLKAICFGPGQALAQAKLALGDVDIFELHDAYTIMAALSLEVRNASLIRRAGRS